MTGIRFVDEISKRAWETEGELDSTMKIVMTEHREWPRFWKKTVIGVRVEKKDGTVMTLKEIDYTPGMLTEFIIKEE